MSPSPLLSAVRHGDEDSASGSRTWTCDLAATHGQYIMLRGWLHHRRALKSVLFLILRDATGTAQIVVEDAAARRELESLTHESVISVAGMAVATPRAPGGVEVHDPVVTVISRAMADPPIELYHPDLAASLPSRLDAAAVTLRHPKRAMVQRMTAAALDGFRSALREQRFVEISTPKIVGSATEGGANVFALDYFGRQAYLAQSPQLYKQIMVGALERVFETAPVFWAEPHDTARHVSQFLSLDAEMGFIDDHRTVMAVLTRTIRRMIAAIGELDPIAHCTGLVVPDLPDVPETIPDIHFRDALDLIREATGEDIRHEPDLAPAHERWLGSWAQRTHGSEWLYVTGYPMVKRPF
ncbi:MAG: OB-fold nucleic acid binding domain-containing protein, partial [Chloroflexota bacterium]|nr:OB-fold nucleic acid binding domain-containing protein [Chloroflexota bacterium]